MMVHVKLGTKNGNEITVQCQRCIGATAHQTLQSVSVSGGDDNFQWGTDHEILQCLGCKSVSFRSVETNSEDYFYTEDDDRIDLETIKIYPPRIAGFAGLGEDLWVLPEKIRRIYTETAQALVNDEPVLTGIGVRAVLETVCKDMKANGASLYEQIDDLVKKNKLTPARALILHRIRTLGNVAAHEVEPHPTVQLALAMSVVDHLLEEVYILPAKAARIFPVQALPPLPLVAPAAVVPPP